MPPQAVKSLVMLASLGAALPVCEKRQRTRKVLALKETVRFEGASCARVLEQRRDLVRRARQLPDQLSLAEVP